MYAAVICHLTRDLYNIVDPRYSYLHAKYFWQLLLKSHNYVKRYRVTQNINDRQRTDRQTDGQMNDIIPPPPTGAEA